jgi:hypothetical protein
VPAPAHTWSSTLTVTAMTGSTFSSVNGANTGAFDAAAAAYQLDNLSVNTQFQFKNNSWMPLYWFYASGVVLQAQCDWLSARDIPVEGSYAIPTLP